MNSSERPNGEHTNGVMLILNNKNAKWVTIFSPTSKHIYVQVELRPIKTKIIQGYAPTAYKPEFVIKEFYSYLNKTI